MVAPSNAPSTCYVVVNGTIAELCTCPVKENVNELSLFPDITAEEPPAVAASTAEPLVVSTCQLSVCPVTAIKAISKLSACPVTAMEAICEIPVCPVMAMEAVCELSACPVTLWRPSVNFLPVQSRLWRPSVISLPVLSRLRRPFMNVFSAVFYNCLSV